MRRASILLAILIVPAVDIYAADNNQVNKAQIQTTFNNLPLYFIENKGQMDEEVAYYVKGADKILFFTSEGITFALSGKNGDKAKRWCLKLDFIDANPDVEPRGKNKKKAVFSYFKGKPEDWTMGVPSYGKLVYQDLWPDIDLVYTGTTHQLKYEFRLKPGADPNRINLTYRGVDDLFLTEECALEVATPAGGFKDGTPMAYQDIEGHRREVPVRYSIKGKQGDQGCSYGFRLGPYDPDEELILDPVLFIYCGYIGGETTDEGRSIDVDKGGNVYITGNTWSTEPVFPVKVGPDLTANGWGMYRGDAFVAKVSADGTQLEYCGFIGGDDDDTGEAIKVDHGGHAYVAGYTRSSEATFPVVKGPDLTHNGNGLTFEGSDAYVAKVKPDGTGLVFCGYIGGREMDRAYGLALDDEDNVYIAGITNSDESTFPVMNGPDLTYNGDPYTLKEDGFVARVKADGTGLDYCGYIGGTDYDYAIDIDVDSQGHAYLTGMTISDESSFPVLVGPDLTYNGGIVFYGDAYVAKVNPDGTGLLYCGYIGGLFHDHGTAIAVDPEGCAYVTGSTESPEYSFPVLVGPDLTFNGSPPNFYADGFVAKVTAHGKELEYCGYMGGELPDYGYSIDTDRFGRAYVTGFTYSSENQGFPVKYGPDLSFNGGYGYSDAFVARVDSTGGALDFCGYIGGNRGDEGWGIVVDDAENIYITGMTGSMESSFPLKIGPYLKPNGGVASGPDDAFVAKLIQSLRSDAYSLSAGSGGVVYLFLNAGEENKQRNYLILGSITGTEPGTPLPGAKATLPLNWDLFTNVIISIVNTPVFTNFQGILDGQGSGMALMNLPPIPGAAGLTMYFAYALNNPWNFASNPVEIEIVP
jgi:hypothetical protein